MNKDERNKLLKSEINLESQLKNATDKKSIGLKKENTVVPELVYQGGQYTSHLSDYQVRQTKD